MNLYIELEVYNREIEAKMLLALEAVKRGYNVIIAHRSIIQKLALQNELPPGIIHMKDANSIKYQIEILKKLKKKNFYFTAQDEESGLLNKKYDTFAKIRFNNYKAFNFLNYFFCWGKRDYNYLKKKTKAAILTGSPRFDLFHGKKKIKKTNNKKILIISSFNVTGVRSFADRIFSTTSQRDKHYEIAEKFAYDVESIHALKVYHFVKLIKFLSKTFKNYDICLRPHYHDKYDDWKKLINSNAKNITIDKIENYPLYKSILNSDFVIQNGCTSAIESLLLNVPCISYMPQEWKEDEMAQFPNSLGIKATNYKQVEKIIQSGNIKKNDIKNKILKERFFFEKNSYAFEKQVNIFDEINQNFNKFEPSLYLKTKFFLKKILKKLINKIYKKERSPFEQKFPEFKEKKIKRIINEIAASTHKNDYLDTKFNIISERLLFLKK